MKFFVLLVVLPILALAGSLRVGLAQDPPIPDLAKRLGCFACHAVKGVGGNLSVPLDGVGARLSRQKLQVALSHPRQLHPGAKMPSYAYLPAAEQEVLVHYLEGLK